MVTKASIAEKTKEIFHTCMNKNISFVNFRLPNEKNSTTYIQRSKPVKEYSRFDDIINPDGFILSSAQSDENQRYYIVSPEIEFSGIQEPDFYDELLHQVTHFPTFNRPVNNYYPEETTREEFISNVEIAKAYILENKLNKVVLSKLIKEKKKSPESYFELFELLSKTYPKAFVYLLFLPQTGLWVGATPEPLLEVENGTASLISLAGTKKIDKETDIKKFTWRQKELWEQKIVSNYIEDVVKKHFGNNFSKHGPETFRIGNLLHILTKYTLTNFSFINGKLSQFLTDLHPAPSIGGQPRDESIAFIKQHEHHHRELYTGFLGPLRPNGLTKLYVNIRCVKILPDEYLIYAGAGITADSDPIEEWNETEDKKMATLSVIRKI